MSTNSNSMTPHDEIKRMDECAIEIKTVEVKCKECGAPAKVACPIQFAVPAPMQQSGWQPIETAPKDGTEILLGVDIATVWIVRNGRWDNGEYWEEQGFDSQEEITGWWAYTNSVGQEMLCGIYEPTHWMLMKEPPEASND